MWAPNSDMSNAPVAQWIEHWIPNPCAQVRFLPGAPIIPIFFVVLNFDLSWRMAYCTSIVHRFINTTQPCVTRQYIIISILIPLELLKLVLIKDNARILEFQTVLIVEQ